MTPGEVEGGDGFLSYRPFDAHAQVVPEWGF